MKNFQQLKQDMEVDIDGMLVNEKEKNIFNFKKISIFNLSIFSVLGLIHYSLSKCYSTKPGKKSFSKSFYNN